MRGGGGAAGWQVPALLAVVIATTYANALHGPFVFDDWHTLEQNPHIRSLANAPRFFVDADTTSVLRENKDLRPLLLITFAANYAMSGADTWTWHLTSLFLHWLACVLLFRVVRDHLWLGDAGPPVAAAAALIVALHPLNSEPANYLSSRSALLTAVCYLGAFDAAVRGRRATSVLLAAAAMLTKTIALTLPVVVLLHAWIDRRRIPWGLIGMLTTVVAAGLAWRALLLPPWVLDTARQPDVGPGTYLMTQWSALLYYVRLWLWPNALVIDRVDYPWVRSFFAVQAWGSLLVLTALGITLWRLGRRWPAVGFAALWIVVTLAPESSVVPLAEAVNEHRPYLAMLGFGTLTALAAWTLAGRRLLPFAIGVAVLVTALGVATHARNRIYQDDLALWQDAVAKAPGNARAWLNAGHAAMVRGQDDEARRLLLEAHRLSPCYAYIQMNLSALDARGGKLDESLRWADEAARCQPTVALTHEYRASALERLGRTDEALAAYRQVTALDAVHAAAWSAQGRLLEARSAWADAATAWDRALVANPTDADAAMHAGLLYTWRLDDPARAVDRFRTVLVLMPTHYGAHYQLAVALLADGHADEARAAWQAFVPMAQAIGDTASIASAPAGLR
ncbi:MAG TPA: tetratricopeptide repeat protein [Candidatus Binatia bacterium]|jgi:tetratricopeptide (TPR) repeat protein|nr:tetratricopeptide repeat protein [Candidatus Binatia bacterium]